MSTIKKMEARINLKNAEHNFHEIVRYCNGASVIAVVKADAYGHGACELSRLYEHLGAVSLAVARLEEALEIRNCGVSLPILIFGYTSPEHTSALIKNNFIQAVYSLDYAKALSAEAAKCGSVLKIHIKTDTGMTRIGIYAHHGFAAAAADEIEKICNLSNISAEGIFTHFAEAELSDKSFTDEQFDSFSEVVSELSGRGVTFKFCHCANSAGVLNYKKSHMNCVRPGLSLYGLNPGVQNLSDIELRPVMTLATVVADVRNIRKGDTVSYNRTFRATHDMRVAIVAAGYADGIPRCLSNRAAFLINGRRAPILGNICMDLIALDVSDIPGVSQGDEVVIFGKQGDCSLPIDELAKKANTISYELLTSVSSRVPRTYVSSEA